MGIVRGWGGGGGLLWLRGVLGGVVFILAYDVGETMWVIG